MSKCYKQKKIVRYQNGSRRYTLSGGGRCANYQRRKAVR
nr:MAG TPA: hypothetical protein [Caudoviricetes sp.]DAM90493.1 MAG TPA: hypothetical protein [Caudoviricetes sp.]DAS60384.1 MAG TPA: hypothetical protein [Caudoviricetes sp.]